MEKNVNTFCALVAEINAINDKLNEEREDYYDGGYSFESLHKTEYEKLEKLHGELKLFLMNIINGK